MCCRRGIVSPLDPETATVLFLGLIFACGGLISAASALELWWHGRRSRHWPRAIGRIVEEWTEVQRVLYGRTASIPRVRYEYEVDGMLLEGGVIELGDEGECAWRPTRVRHYTPTRARRVEVAYDPMEPEHSVLKPGVPAGTWAYVFIAAVCFAVDLLLLVRQGRS